MKLGIHLSSFTKNWNDDLLPWIQKAAEIGYQAVELPLMNPWEFDTAQVKQHLTRYQLLCTCGTGLNDSEDISSQDLQVQAAGVARLKRCVDICRQLETDCLGGVLYAPWGLQKPRENLAARYEQSASALAEVGHYAGTQGVTLALELLNRYESSWMNTVTEGLAFLRRVGSDSVCLHFDTFHSFIEEQTLAGAIHEAQAKLYHVHLCDNNRAAPGTGGIDFMAVLQALNNVGYQRFLMVENFVLPGTQAGNATSIWRKSAAGVVENATTAFHNIQKLLSAM